MVPDLNVGSHLLVSSGGSPKGNHSLKTPGKTSENPRQSSWCPMNTVLGPLCNKIAAQKPSWTEENSQERTLAAQTDKHRQDRQTNPGKKAGWQVHKPHSFSLHLFLTNLFLFGYQALKEQ